MQPYNWEGNRRSDVALAVRYRLHWFIHLRAQGLNKEDEHPTYTPHGLRHSLPLAFNFKRVDTTATTTTTVLRLTGLCPGLPG